MQVVLDRAGTEEQLVADVGVGEPVAGEPGDLLLLRREVLAHLEVARARLRACGDQLSPGAVSERLHPHLGEHLLGDPKLLARLAAATLPAQPLAVDQPCAREFRTERRPAQPFDRLVKQRLGRLAVAHERARASLHAERKVSARGLSCRCEPVERIPCELCLAEACRRLDELG